MHVSDFGLCAFRQLVLDWHPSSWGRDAAEGSSGAPPSPSGGGRIAEDGRSGGITPRCVSVHNTFAVHVFSWFTSISILYFAIYFFASRLSIASFQSVAIYKQPQFHNTLLSSHVHSYIFRYASPEALEGQNPSLVISEPSDVYAFGSLIYEVLEVKVPWSNLDESQIVTRVIARGARPTFTTTGNTTAAAQQEGKGGDGSNNTNSASRNQDLIALAQKCWFSDPSQRPSFSDIVVELASSDRSEAAGRGDIGSSV